MNQFNVRTVVLNNVKEAEPSWRTIFIVMPKAL